jgi:hypothetical protein
MKTVLPLAFALALAPVQLVLAEAPAVAPAVAPAGGKPAGVRAFDEDAASPAAGPDIHVAAAMAPTDLG